MIYRYGPADKQYLYRLVDLKSKNVQLEENE